MNKRCSRNGAEEKFQSFSLLYFCVTNNKNQYKLTLEINEETFLIYSVYQVT